MVRTVVVDLFDIPKALYSSCYNTGGTQQCKLDIGPMQITAVWYCCCCVLTFQCVLSDHAWCNGYLPVQVAYQNTLKLIVGWRTNIFPVAFACLLDC